MKTLSAPVLAALASGSVAIATLIKLDFAGTPVLLNTSTWNLVWQRRYNLLTYSQQLTNAIWLTNGPPAVTANYAAAPDGTTTATRAVFATGNLHRLTNQFSAAGQTVTFSIYVKSNTGSVEPCQIYLRETGFGASYAALSFGATTDWQRVSITGNIPGGSAGVMAMVYHSASGDPAWDLLLWGAQVELGDIASTYTPTTTTALTETGETYLGAYGLGQISAIADKPGEAAGITLELHGADAARISLALDDADIVQGTPCTIRTAIIDTATYTILDAPIEWVGKLDTMAIGEDGTSATIGVTAESAAVDLLRGNAWTFTDADQRIVNASDASFSYVLDQIDKPIIWPTKAFFYK